MKNSNFDKFEIQRYARHLILPDFNIKGQYLLKQSRVLIVGAGGLGSPILLYLAAAGIGTIGIIDFDVVEISNLQRQILYTIDDIHLKKATVAKDKLQKLNPHVNYHVYNELLSNENALNILSEYDLIIDGTDNFPARYLINDACVFLNKPFVYGSIYQFEGQVSVFNYQTNQSKFPCYRCLYPNPPPANLVPNCSEGGVLGVLPGIIGSIQANEAIKLLAQVGQLLIGRLFIFDALAFTTNIIDFSKDDNCPVCCDHPTITQLQDYNLFCKYNEYHLNKYVKQITVKELKNRFDNLSAFQLIDVREAFEREISSIGGDLIPLSMIESEIKSIIGKIEVDKEVILYCRDGSRSKSAILLIEKEYGFSNLFNLQGGIQEWALKIDHCLPIY